MSVVSGVEFTRTKHGRLWRTAVLAWFFVCALVVCGGTNPHASAVSRLQQFGALQSDDVPMLVAHRGAALHAPENTLAAIRQAVSQHANAIELDVRRTADNVPVLLHDAEVNRTTNGTGNVHKQLSADIAALDAGAWFHVDFIGEGIPTLSEAITEVEAAPVTLFLELKDDWNDAQLVPVVAELRERLLLDRVVLQSFDAGTLEALQRVAPEFARVMLIRDFNTRVTDQAIALGVSGVGAETQLFAAYPFAAAQMRERGLGTAVFTLNSADEWRFAAEFGFDLVFSDDPLGYSQWRESYLAEQD